MASGERVMGRGAHIERPDGSRVPVLMNVSPVKSPSGPRYGRRLQLSGIDRTQTCRRGVARERSRAPGRDQPDPIHAGPVQPRRAVSLHQPGLCADDALSARRRRGQADRGHHRRERFRGAASHIETVLRGEAVEFDCEIDFPEAGKRFLHIAYRPEMDALGNVDGWIASLLDITARKSDEAVLARRAHEQASLYRFTDRLYRAASLTDIYDAALDAITGALHCDRASILRFDQGGVMRFVRLARLVR